uniref:Pogo transposable element derived with ZNF domain b n=1 Tax=Sphaeramia orbicularis TaxID=375764 RepID=A0A673B8M8_9TELE
MDTELFMECEEEELEPWQQVDDSVEEDDMDYIEPLDRSPSPLPASETPPPSSRPAPVGEEMPMLNCRGELAEGSFNPLVAYSKNNTKNKKNNKVRDDWFWFVVQAFPMVNPGGPLLLNLQPGQTVQPLTLIQSPSLGQLVRPSVGVSPVQNRPGPTPSGGQGSTFTSMQLPTTLTIRTSTPGPRQYHTGSFVHCFLSLLFLCLFLFFFFSSFLDLLIVTHVGGANTLKLAGAPALPSGSANGVTKIRPTFGGNTTVVSSSSQPSDPPKVVMSVEEFYYGTFDGDLSLRRPQPLGIKTSTFTCQICSHLADNNLRSDTSHLTTQNPQPPQVLDFALKIPVKTLLFMSYLSCMCRICEWAFENEPTFLNHMKTNHKPGEMPYVCQVCSFRSSFYSDVLQHFNSFHRDSRFLLCVFCLKVTSNPTNYQQHLLRHQAFHCNRCRLQFVFLKDKMQHKIENHRSFRRPTRLEGLPPGSKVSSLNCHLSVSGSSRTLPPLFSQSSSRQRCSSPQTRRVLRFQNPLGPQQRDQSLVCLECGTSAADLTSHYPTHVRCLLCPYSSCCSRAYATHMIHRYSVQCSYCDFRPHYADQMAEHLMMNPQHYSATCRLKFCYFLVFTEPDIQFFMDEQQSTSENKLDQEFPAASWSSVDCQKETVSSIVHFSQTSGPHHSLSKNSDAIDFFNLLFPSALIELITKETNAHAKTSRFLGSSFHDWVPVTTHEIKGFIGLVILMGIQNLPDPSHYWSWNHYDNSYTFYRAMSFKRFKQISANIRMGSFITNELRGTSNPSDSLHIFRPMMKLLSKAMWDAYQPNCCLTIDRALLPSLDETNPKTQPQVWLLCDSKSGYCHRFFIQVRTRLCIYKDIIPGFTVVPELVHGLEHKHHQLYLANSLTSASLMQMLLDQGLYASSSFPPRSHILPRELWDEGSVEKAGDFLQKRCGPLLVTRWRDMKEMGCLSTNAAPGNPDTVWRRSQTKVGGLDPIQRPMAFRLLQENMRGVDICKQLLACNPLGGIQQDQHWRSLFWLLVNLSIVNAFIVLRESRKDNPPAWVQDGLFTQVNFRKRLGNQLAKCAQKYFETVEIASSRGTRTVEQEEPVKQRHRMAKISGFTKRCKNCHENNIRRESVYGCIICKVNLCKHPNCFWEFHGLSPLNKDDNEEDEEDEEEEEEEEVKYSASETLPSTNVHIQPSAGLSASKDRDDVLSARQLRITLLALCEGLPEAARVFSTEPQLIRTWLKEVQCDGEDQMLVWVLSMREQQLPITESSLFHKVSTLKKKGSFGKSFRISYDWAVSFMLKNCLEPCSVGRTATLERVLPQSTQTKVKAFREFTQKAALIQSLSEVSVAAMDELCLFVDPRLILDKNHRGQSLQLTGLVPLVTVYLTALSNGSMLPSLVLANHPMDDKPPSDFMVLETVPENLLAEEALDMWTSKVWKQYVSGPDNHRKGCWMLVLDRHREHMGDPFLGAVSGFRTLPAMIPAGCTSHFQPLEMCVKPVLQRFLLNRWIRFSAGDPKELEEGTEQNQLQANITSLLVDWIAEALKILNKVPDLLKKSFQLTGLLPPQKEEEEETKSLNPGEIQLNLLKTLTETLLSPEDLQEELCEELGPEDEEEEEKREEKETTEEERMETEENKEETAEKNEEENSND